MRQFSLDMRVKSQAPTKVTLFGEHAVVYGFPAIVMAVPKYIEVEMKEDVAFNLSSGPISMERFGIKVKGGKVELDEESSRSILKVFSYVIEALKEIGLEGASVKISSPLPMGAGMGTSAAVTVATLLAGLTLKGKRVSEEELADMAWEVEKKVQGMASPMDTSASALGGILKVYKKKDWHRERLKAREMPLVVGIFEKRASTGEIVKLVKTRMERIGVLKRVMEIIGEISLKAEEAINSGDLTTLGELMMINNSLLEALGVVDRRVANAVHAAVEAGALGAKVSGAGLGGAVIALVEKDKMDEVTTALKLAGARQAFRVTSPSLGAFVRV